ncbi:MAG: STING domain-containing protein [Rhodomicrobium sp.]
MSQFSGRLAGGRFSVFIIGPMGSDKDVSLDEGGQSAFSRWFRRRRSPEKTQVPVSAHTSNIGEAAKSVLRSLGLTEAQFDVYVPQQLVSAAIKDDVFHRIDLADFGIADISTTSRNVMYEVAYFNALGTPLVLIDYRNTTPPFYLTQQRVLTVADFTVEALASQLNPVLSAYLRADDVNLSDNPITQFYNSALVDISATTGVAVGFFENFAHHVLVQGGVLSENPDIKELVMIRPERINDLQRDNARVNAVMRSAERRTLKAPSHPRKEVTARVLSDAIVDFPTPLYALDSAPRYRKLRDRMRSMGAPQTRVDDMLAKFEAKLIDSYFLMVENLVSDAKNMSRQSWRVVDIADFEANGLQRP